MVLEGVRVHCVEAQPQMCRVLAKPAWVIWKVPRNMQTDGAICARHPIDRGDVIELLLKIPRLAADCEATEACAARAQRPGWHGHAESHQLLEDRRAVQPALF